MNNLSTEIEELRKKYREIFIETCKEFENKIQHLNEEEFINFLNKDITKEIYLKQKQITESRKKFKCEGCAACCKLACSEFSLEELKQKSQNGDNFAQQFLSVFVPYESESEAEKIYPEYFKLLKEKKQNEKIYFYYCPKLTKDNRCPDYENRPQICKDFPDNPLGLLPITCGFKTWKKEVETIALKLHSLFEILEFYKKKLLS